MIEENNSTGIAFSEAASENKRRRGRPTVFQRDHMEEFDRLITGAYRLYPEFCVNAEMQ